MSDDENDLTGEVSCAEAREILSRFNASHWRDSQDEHARYSIPANPRYDDDIRLSAFIKQAERDRAEITRLRALVDAADALWVDAAERLAGMATDEDECGLCGVVHGHANGCALAVYDRLRTVSPAPTPASE